MKSFNNSDISSVEQPHPQEGRHLKREEKLLEPETAFKGRLAHPSRSAFKSSSGQPVARMWAETPPDPKPPGYALSWLRTDETQVPRLTPANRLTVLLSNVHKIKSLFSLCNLSFGNF